jgi:hypothetical protein
MKKNDEETSKEVVSKLVWRLKTTPTVDEVQSLLEKDVITKEEAREILFNVEQEEATDTTSLQDLKKEIEFMRGMMLQIMNNGSTRTVIEYVHKYPQNQFEWIRPYYILANNLPKTGFINTVNLSSGTGTAIASANTGMWSGSTGVTNYVNHMGTPIKGIKAMQNGEFDVSSDENHRYIS